MAQSITLLGATYNDVPAVLLPKTGGGTAQFDDTTIASNAASASDIASGKLAYVNGVLVTGTSSGGGGSNWTKIASKEFTVSTTSTSQTSIGNIDLTLSDYNSKDKIVWVHVRDKAGKRNGYFYGTDALFFPYTLANANPLASISTKAVISFCVNSNGSYGGYAAANGYGVYAYSIYYQNSSHYIDMYRRYSSSYSLTINGTYVCDVYVLTPPTDMTLFA